MNKQSLTSSVVARQLLVLAFSEFVIEVERRDENASRCATTFVENALKFSTTLVRVSALL